MRPTPELSPIPDYIKNIAEGVEDTEADKEQAVEATLPEEERKSKINDEVRKRMANKYTFNFSFTSGSREFSGVFTHTIPNVRVQRAIGLYRAQLSGGVDYTTLDPFTRELCLMIAHFALCLDCSKNPQGHWSHNMEEVEDFRLLQALYEEVMAHEATFLGQ